MRVEVSSLLGFSTRPAAKKAALVLTRERGHSLRPDKIPKNSRAGAQMLAQFPVGEDMEPEGKQGRTSREVGSFISETVFGVYCVVDSGGSETRLRWV